MAVVANKRSVMVLYSGSTDMESHRTRIVLAEKGILVDVIEVERQEENANELDKINPYKSVPTLVDRDLVLFKSQIIMEYLDERFPHPPLLPVYPVARAKSRLMIHRIERDWYTLVDQIENGDEEAASNAREKLCDSILELTPVFADSPYFLSEEFSLIDCCIAPILWRLPKLGIELPTTAKPIFEYEQRIFERDSFKASLTESEREIRLDAEEL